MSKIGVHLQEYCRLMTRDKDFMVASIRLGATSCAASQGRRGKARHPLYSLSLSL